jgi:hypothetical protein
MRFACVFLLLAGALSMAQEVDVERFSVISYNVQARPVLDDSKWKMPLIGERLKEYGIIGLQEAFRRQELLFAKCPKHATFYEQGKRHAFKIVNSGLAIMSVFPLSDQTFVHFENEGSLENRLGSKGVMLGRIKIGDATWISTQPTWRLERKPIRERRGGARTQANHGIHQKALAAGKCGDHYGRLQLPIRRIRKILMCF